MDPSTASYVNRPVSPVRPRWQPPATERPQSFVRPQPAIPQPAPVEQPPMPPAATPVAPTPDAIPQADPKPQFTPTPSTPVPSQPTFYAPPEVKPSANQLFNHPVATPKHARLKTIARRGLALAHRYRKPLLVAGATLTVVLVVFSGVKVAAFAVHSHRTAQSNARNATRVADLTSLQTNLETFYAAHHDYPTYAQLNEANFRLNNLPSISDTKLKDPTTTSTNLAPKPTKNSYSYQVWPAGCDNSSVKCIEYEVAAVLDNGTPISKMNPVH